ncbi:ABC transporter permease [Marinigracilibium pacificum]|uniref:ABC transport system permease protein n=1 Tax=Marinigracilibium pacificum TaxID=2729599 RepID=A0A848J2K4_9BACT|nr:ABC transporter permease [Marinigracilibium pacificum]NMM48770.1 hypothetical protein [Marinigracilibium pacificum]
MIKSDLRIIFRKLKRHLSFTFINVIGLSISMSVIFLISIYLYSELSFDDFHEKSDRIERLTMHIQKPGYDMHWARVNFDLVNQLEDEFSEIEHLIRFQDYYPRNFIVGENSFQLENAYSVDKDVFEVFDFELLEGDSKYALEKPNSIVLTESTAMKFFGSTDVIGKEVELIQPDGVTKVRYLVTALMKDLPENTHLPVNLLTSINGEDQRTGWAYVYLLLNDKGDAKSLESKFGPFISEFGGEDMKGVHFKLQNLGSIHLNSDLAREIIPNGNTTYIYLFALVGMVILILSVVNFINLNAAKSIRAIKEVGVRKVLGSTTSDLKKYYFLESFLVVLVAAIISIGVTFITLPYFKQLTVLEINIYPFVGLFFILVILISFAGGYFPSFFLSKQKIADSFRNKIAGIEVHSRFSPRNILIAGQVVLCIITISVALITSSQFSFIVNKNLGIDKDQVLAITNIPGSVKWKMNRYRNSLNSISGVKGVTTAMEVPSREIRDSGPVYAEGKIAEDNKDVSMDMQVVDKTFIEVMGLSLISGRNFSKFKSNDISEEIDKDIYGHLQNSPREYIINETAMKTVGWDSPEEAIGKMFSWSIGGIQLQKGPIIGVVKDYHQETLKNGVDPVVFINEPVWVNNILVKIEGKNVDNTLNQIITAWEDNYPGLPITYSFLDDLYDKLYRSEKNQLTLIYIFSSLAILIAFVGMFGVISYSMKSREKELAVRKIHGATLKSLGVLMTKDFLLITVPILPFAFWATYKMMEKWLSNYVYKIDIEVWHFLVAPAIILLVISINISLQLLKASSKNPALILKSE